MKQWRFFFFFATTATGDSWELEGSGGDKGKQLLRCDRRRDAYCQRRSYLTLLQ